jgi:hypothetical protein
MEANLRDGVCLKTPDVQHEPVEFSPRREEFRYLLPVLFRPRLTPCEPAKGMRNKPLKCVRNNANTQEQEDAKRGPRGAHWLLQHMTRKKK